MLVLLPPSEGKNRPGRRRPPVRLEDLSWPELTAARHQVLDALVAVSAAPDAVQRLGVGASLADEVAANVLLRQAPAAPAREVYHGVLFQALDLAGLSDRGRRRAARSLVVVSALWGALRVGDRIPAYRLSMGTTLTGLGPLAAHWRSALTGPLDDAAAGGLVVDCRSSSYQAAWSPTGGTAARMVAVRVLREQHGRRSVVSHMAKLTRGQVVRHLLERPAAEPRTPAALAAAVAEAFPAELVRPIRPGTPWTIDVVLPG